MTPDREEERTDAWFVHWHEFHDHMASGDLAYRATFEAGYDAGRASLQAEIGATPAKRDPEIARLEEQLRLADELADAVDVWCDSGPGRSPGYCEECGMTDGHDMGCPVPAFLAFRSARTPPEPNQASQLQED